MTAPKRAALVTGAGRRIGAALARALAAAGWFVHVHHHRSASEAEAVAAEICAAGGGARAIGADLAALDAAGAEALIAQCRGNGPALLALVNNASLFENDGATTLTDASWSRHLQVNLTAPIMLARAFANGLSHLAAGETGSIVNILDNKVAATNPDFFSYTISKQALDGATRTLALALAPTVRVNGIAPGITMISRLQTEERFTAAHRNNPLGRGCTQADIARAALFILDTPSLTGETIVIDGGQALTRPPRDVVFL
jgi:NAD(P)-dependent dehydrogenase (short-subunit alcohol dehydrogenase family)